MKVVDYSEERPDDTGPGEVPKTPSTTPRERQISERWERSMNLSVPVIVFPLEITFPGVYFHCLQYTDSRNYHFENRKLFP